MERRVMAPEEIKTKAKWYQLAIEARKREEQCGQLKQTRGMLLRMSWPIFLVTSNLLFYFFYIE